MAPRDAGDFAAVSADFVDLHSLYLSRREMELLAPKATILALVLGLLAPARPKQQAISMETLACVPYMHRKV